MCQILVIILTNDCLYRFGSAEEFVIVAFACTFALMVYYYSMSHDDLSEHLASAAMSSPSRLAPGYRSSYSSTVQSNAYDGEPSFLFCKGIPGWVFKILTKLS